MLRIFLEFFKNKKTLFWFESLINHLYRKYLGVIIWRVLTFDLVKIVAPTNSKYDNLIFKKSNENFIRISNETNVYDSITLSSLISSKGYLDLDQWLLRANKYMKINNRNKIIWIETDPYKTSRNYVIKNPFINCIVKKIEFKKGLLNKSKNQFDSFLLYERKGNN